MADLANIRSALYYASNMLDRLDSEVLLAFVLNKPRSYLYSWPDTHLTQQQQADFTAYIQRRLKGEPVAYLTNKQEFWSLDFYVTHDVLIPRPETERLVETTLALITHHAAYFPTKRLVDLGTGSGCIAIALAHELPDWQITAIDQSTPALAVAGNNAKRLGIENIHFIKSDWLHDYRQSPFDIIVSNPPYIDANDSHLQASVVKYEPSTALIADNNGLADIQTITTQATSNLHDNGYLLIEIGFDQRQQVENLLRNNGFSVSFSYDYAGHARIAIGSKN